mmetsp:Transcript_19040/g.34429  ORF Transcript_19040/g.34429 Transcript_19040/m.34429 type:complete len:1022 (+) Transcript_19040:116-3181(+)
MLLDLSRHRWQKSLLVYSLLCAIDQGSAVRDDAAIDKDQVRVSGRGHLQLAGASTPSADRTHGERLSGSQSSRKADLDEADTQHRGASESRSRRRRRSAVTTVEYGDPHCRCLGWDLHLQNDTGHSLRSEAGRSHSVGATCSTWADGSSEACDGEDWEYGSSGCHQHWCYVDPCNCDLKDRPRLADASAGTWLGRRLHYSYATCGGREPTSIRTEVHGGPCPSTTSRDTCEKERSKDGTSKCLFVNGECIEKTFSADCDSKLDEAVYGRSTCRCVGIGNISGGIVYNVSNGTRKLYPASSGSMCHDWDDGRHPDCLDSNPLKPSWCSLKWCFVDPCDCADPGPVRRYPYTDDVTFRGMPLYYSFSTCGEDDEDICSKKPNASLCHKATGCSWDGAECRDSNVLSAECNASDTKHWNGPTTTAIGHMNVTRFSPPAARKATAPHPAATTTIHTSTTTTTSEFAISTTASQEDFVVAGGQVVLADYTTPLHEPGREELCQRELQAVHRSLESDLALRVKWRNSPSGKTFANVSAAKRAEAREREALKAIEYLWAGHKESALVALGKIQQALAEISFERGVLDAPWVFTEGDARTLLQCLGHRSEEEAPVEEGSEQQGKDPTMHFVEGDMATTSEEEKSRLLADIAAGEQWSGEIWDNGQVYYCYAPGVSDRVVKAFERARAHVAQQVSRCIQFHLVPVKSDVNETLRCECSPSIIVHEMKEVVGGCWSQVGRAYSGSQHLQLGPGCEFAGLAAHQLLHALGMLHIQPHPDVFKLHLTHRGLLDGESEPPASAFHSIANPKDMVRPPADDLLSLMHWPSFLRWKEWRVSLEPQQASMRRFLGQRHGLSALDVEKLRARYGCSASVEATAARQQAVLAQVEPHRCWDSRERWIQLPFQPSDGKVVTFNCSTAKDYCSSSDAVVADFAKAMCPLACGACGSMETFEPFLHSEERQERGIARHGLAKDYTTSTTEPALRLDERELVAVVRAAFDSSMAARRDQRSSVLAVAFCCAAALWLHAPSGLR